MLAATPDQFLVSRMVPVTDASQCQGVAEGDEPLRVQALQPAAGFSIPDHIRAVDTTNSIVYLE